MKLRPSGYQDRRWVEVTNWFATGTNGGLEIGDCIVNVNTPSAGVGRPYGKWLSAIVTHEVAHCLGHWHHAPTRTS